MQRNTDCSPGVIEMGNAPSANLDGLDVSCLGAAFRSTNGPNKYLFFLSLLDLACASRDASPIPLEKVIQGAVARAWVPKVVFKLSLGRDSLLGPILDLWVPETLAGEFRKLLPVDLKLPEGCRQG